MAHTLKTTLLLSLLLLTLCSSAFADQPNNRDVKRWMESSFTQPDRFFFSFRYNDKPFAQLLNRCTSDQLTRRSDMGRLERDYIFTDPATGVQLTCTCTLWENSSAVEWFLRIKNTGKRTTPIISDLLALDMVTDRQRKDPVLHYARGAVCSWDDFQPLRRVLNRGARITLQPGGGRSSSDFLPFFNLEQADHSSLIIAVGWSGEWKTEFSTDSSRATRIRSGMAHTRLVLHPQEEIRSPRIALIFYQGAVEEGQNLLRRHLLAHHRPKRNNQPFSMPLFAAGWGGTPATTHLDDCRKIIEADLPVDYYWIDAEWFGTGKWHQTVGDWRVKEELYPKGLRPISDLLHSAQRFFLLWVEPERVCQTTPWYREHSPWLLSVPQAQRHYNWGRSQAEPDWVKWESLRNQICDNDRLFNLADPAARKFLTDYFSQLIETHGIDCFRHDANIGPLEFWRAADAPDRQGWTEIKWVEGLYAFWDELLQRHPGLIIDNCASGGRRVDLETLSRSTPFWRTDFPSNTTAKQCHTYGLASWVPLNATGDVRPMTDDLYSFRSTFSSSMVLDLSGIGAMDVGDAKLARANKLLQQYRAVQEYFLGDYYPLSCYSQAEDAWMAWQFNRPDLGEGMVQVFRRPQSFLESGSLPLFGLEPEARYVVRNQDEADDYECSGRELMEKGLAVHLPGRPAAAVMVYKKKR